MKKLLFGIIAFTALNLQAQVDPITQFVTKTYLPGLAPYDSITVSGDTGIYFNPVITAAQHYFTNGNIDTLVLFSLGNPVYIYDGKLSGRTTTISGMSPGNTIADEKIIIEQDVQYRDTALRYMSVMSAGGPLQFIQDLVISYNSNNQISKMDVFNDTTAGRKSAGDYNYFYDANGIDSLYFTEYSQIDTVEGYFEYYYDINKPSQLNKVEIFMDMDGDGEMDTIQRMIIKNNPLQQITGYILFGMDQNGDMVLGGEARYSKRKNSTISLPEVGEVTLSLYPNPAYDHLQLEIDKEIFSQYEIISINGQLMDSGEAMKKLNVSHLDRGVYILKLTGEKGSVTTRFNKM